MTSNKSRKPLSPLQQMTMQAASLVQANLEEIVAKQQDSILEIDPSSICNWKFSDRPANELGDIDALSEEFKTIGQLQPAIVRSLVSNSQFKYELIVGERRWRAASQAGIKLKVIVIALDDKTAASFQVAENLSRQNLSDYAQGMSYAKLLADKVFEMKDLQEMFALSPSQISRLLSFAQIPAPVVDAISDFTQVSARTAAEIRAYSEKGQKYIDCLIQLAPRIRSGKLGSTTLKNAIEQILTKSPTFTKYTPESLLNRNGKPFIKLVQRKDHSLTVMLSSGNETVHMSKLYQLIKEDMLKHIQDGVFDETETK